MTKAGNSALPERIKGRLDSLKNEVDDVLGRADKCCTVKLPDSIRFTYRHSAPGDILSEYERAQAICFIIKYENLPNKYSVQFVEYENGWRIGNLPFLRHALNDFRPIIHNQKDAIHYCRVHSIWCRMLSRIDPTEGMVIRVDDGNGMDVTPVFVKYLTERKNAICSVIKSLEFGYLYNGILQHSDERYAERFFEDYVSGKLNYILLRHVWALPFIQRTLAPYHHLINILTYAKPGAL